MSDSDVAVSVRGLGKTFGPIRALEDVSIDIRRGEFLSLLGSSGCGKTTLLRIIGGFEAPTSGDLLIGGRSVLGVPPYRRRSNMIFQHLALFPHLSVAQNIAFGLEVRRLGRTEIDRKVRDALALVRLSGFEHRGIDMLSGGQKQRVAIARAMVNEPEVLLLDEPLGALDLQLRLQMHEELRRIHRETGSTWIFVTHDQGEAMALSDRIAVMAEGRIRQLGTPREIYERPAVRFVAQFVGHANFLEGECQRTGEDGTCSVLANGWQIDARCAEPLAPGSRVVAVIRYENTRVARSDGDAPGIAARVIDLTYHGPTIRITTRADDGTVLVAEAASAETDVPLARGAAVRVSWAGGTVVALPA